MPALFEKLMPTLKEILNTAADGAKVDDKKYATWGKALMESGGPFIRFNFTNSALNLQRFSKVLPNIGENASLWRGH